MNTQTINLWVLGGAAIKISSVLSAMEFNNGSTPEVVFHFVDTSDTEARLVKNGCSLNIIKSTDSISGSGGNRGKNYEAICQQLPEIATKCLTESSKSDINILLYSTGGGSGSTIAYVLSDILLSEGYSMIHFVSNTLNSLGRCSNASNHIASLDNLAIQHECNFPVSVYDTSLYTTFTVTDDKLRGDIVKTLYCLNEGDSGIDSSDRRVILNPMLGVAETSNPGVLALTLCETYEYEAQGTPISVLTLVELGNTDDIGTGAPNIFGGILNESVKENVLPFGEKNALSLIASAGVLNTWSDEINEKALTLKKKSTTGYIGANIKSTTAVKSTMTGGFIS